jgi:hypothetical protein
MMFGESYCLIAAPGHRQERFGEYSLAIVGVPPAPVGQERELTHTFWKENSCHLRIRLNYVGQHQHLKRRKSFMNRRVSVWLTVFTGMSAVLAISALVLQASIETFHGHGSETYVNAQGKQVHWVDVLTLSVAFLVALIVLFTATAIYHWRKKMDLAAIRKLDAENGDVGRKA